ncbi:response regulator transcription factor [uncultured Serinicoccus sp.]|uniref:response regulator transcription factor n=1 Tax=uncultured Serinicoccus sp. TaxID=735514 RepID=UPI00260D329E|nr:response regulator transcription factor [uncultured Serinicoccus sp.]
MIRVVIADDQHLVRGGFSLILNSAADIEVIAEAGDGVEALAAVRRHSPDVVLMDLRMPRMDGIEAIRHLSGAAETRDVPVLVLTTFDDDDDVRQALHAGARGYLLKDIRPDDLITAVRSLASRNEFLLGGWITQRLVTQFISDTSVDVRTHLRPTASWPMLTPRERDVLSAVADGRSNREIATDLHLGYSTVKTHVSHLLAKLDVRDRAQLVALAHRPEHPPGKSPTSRDAVRET